MYLLSSTPMVFRWQKQPGAVKASDLPVPPPSDVAPASSAGAVATVALAAKASEPLKMWEVNFFVAGLDYFLLTNHLRNCSFVHTPVDPVVFPIACEVVRHGRPRSPAKPKDDSPSPKTNDTKKVPSKMIHSPDDQRQCWHGKNWILKIHRTGPKQSRYFLSAFFT